MIQIQVNEQQLSEVIQNAVNKAFESNTNAPPPLQKESTQTLHSIRELADFLGCSSVTAQKYKNEHWIPFRQIGRKVMFDTAAVLQAMEQKGRGVKKR